MTPWLLRALAILCMLCLASTARAQRLALPEVTETGAVTVRAEAGLAELAATISAEAPEALARIRADLDGLPAPARIEIRLVKRAADLAAAAPPGRGAPHWAAGVAYPDAGVVVVATRSGAEPIASANVAVHELAHLALGAALHGRAPRWLNEGFAYLHSSNFSLARAQTLTGMAWFGNVQPLSELEQHFPAAEAEADRAYAQSYDFVAYLARRGRYPDARDDGNRWPFRDFLAAISAGDTPERAAWNAYGASLSELHDEWAQGLRERYLLMPAGLFAMGVWVFGALLLILAYLRKRYQNRARLARWAEEEARSPAPLVVLDVGPSSPGERLE